MRFLIDRPILLFYTTSMPAGTDPSKREKIASGLERDKYGHFVKTVETSDNEHLVDVRIHNPLKKFEDVAEDIRKHQSTTLSFKAQIPLWVSIVILMVTLGLSTFQLGSLFPFCPGFQTTKMGTLHTLQIMETPGRSLIDMINPFSIQPTPIARTKTILFEDGETYVVVVPKGASVVDLNNQEVAVTGELSSCTKSIIVSHPQNISLLIK